MSRTRGASLIQSRSGPTPLQHGMREGMVIGLLALAAYVLLAISTFSVSDPGWSSTGTGAAILNAGGATGAWVADVLQIGRAHV